MSYLFRLEPSKPAASLSFIDSCPRYGGRMVKLQESDGAGARRCRGEVRSRSEPRIVPTRELKPLSESEENSTGSGSKKTHFHQFFQKLENSYRVHRASFSNRKTEKYFYVQKNTSLQLDKSIWPEGRVGR